VRYWILTTIHSIVIYFSRTCRWTPHLPHLGKYPRSFACLNLRSPGSHSHATAVLGRCPGTAPNSNWHVSQLTPPNEVFLSILKSSHHELHIAHCLTLMTPSPRGWEAFPTPGAFTHTSITWAFSPSAPQVPDVTSGTPLRAWCFGHPLWRGARQNDYFKTRITRHK
jgi:hypothetical protein